MIAQPVAHLSGRPTWLCRLCNEDWPCRLARSALLMEYGHDRQTLAGYLAAQLLDALGDLRHAGVTPEALHLRFVGWIRRCRSLDDRAWRKGPDP